MRKIQNIYRFSGMICFLAVLCCFTTNTYAQHGHPLNDYDTLRTSLTEALQNESTHIDTLKNQLSQAEQSKRRILEDISAYKIQLPILNNQLIQTETSIKDLEKSWMEIDTAIRNLSDQMADFSDKRKTVAPMLTQNRDQVALTEKQIEEIQSDSAAGAEIASINNQLQVLLEYLAEKQNLLAALDAAYSEIIEGLGENKQKFQELSDKFDETIKKRKKDALLKRQTTLVNIGLKQILVDFKEFTNQLQAAATPSFWSSQLGGVESDSGLYLISFGFLFLIVLGLIFRLRQYLVRLKDHSALTDRFWSRLAISIVRKSIFLVGSTLFLYLYAHIGPFQSKPPVVWAGLNILLVWLFSEVCIDSLKIYCGQEATTVPKKPAFYLHLLISFSRWFGFGYIFFLWLGSSHSVLIVWRLIFEISLYVWSIVFWNSVQKKLKSDAIVLSPRLSAILTVLRFLSFSVVLIALVLELTGYGLLAIYWFTGWGRTAVVVMGSMLTFLLIREWRPKVEKDQDMNGETTAMPKQSIQWAVVQLLTLMWFGGVIIFLVFAWGGKQAVLLGIFKFLQHTYQVGTMRFSLMGLIIAILILLLTQAVARVWQHIFRENILNQSGMEEGLQDSITTISVYVIWAVGILIALNAFGFNATSLTVVLGALGIGLGFGLQAIFNNFISGIILLFERPIQVGDDIEVNGLWARVRKINVRSTVVQTYDNASLIIPNSDLISSQVTNWSFKDKRLRRTVEVGVAYGSDIELVRNTLMEVADKTPRVLKLPKPEVIFRNFGDSALIFHLRLWTRVEYFLSVETDVRFEIDRLFRERKIEIAFPQRDIHIRSGFKDDKPIHPEQEPPDASAEIETAEKKP